MVSCYIVEIQRPEVDACLHARDRAVGLGDLPARGDELHGRCHPVRPGGGGQAAGLSRIREEWGLGPKE